MKQNQTTIDYQNKTTLDIADRGHIDYLTRKWGVSVHQLRAAVRATRSEQVKKIEEYLREKGQFKATLHQMLPKYSTIVNRLIKTEETLDES